MPPAVSIEGSGCLCDGGELADLPQRRLATTERWEHIMVWPADVGRELIEAGGVVTTVPADAQRRERGCVVGDLTWRV